METKRILLVDDQRDFARMFRTALSSLGKHCVVVDVPSGEEAMLEVRRGPFDLVITDLLLPGIDGVELSERIYKVRPNAQIMVITGNPTPKLETYLQERPPFAYFIKPLDMPVVLDKVREALGMPPSKGRLPDFAETGPTPTPEKRPSSWLSTDELGSEASLSDRLIALRRDLGALAVYLVDETGEIVVRAGDVSSLDMEPVLAHLEVAFNAGLRVSNALGRGASLNLSYYDGSDFDMYCANVGQFYMLVMLFGGEAGANQMGPVMRFGRRAADDLLNSIAGIGLERFNSHPAPEPTDMKVTSTTTRVTGAATKEIEDEIRALLDTHTPEKAELPPDEISAGAEADARAAELEAIELDLGVLDEALASLNVAAVDADSFWDSAADELSEGSEGNNLSFEQAMKLGLFSDEE